MAVELGTAYVSVVPSATGITGNLSKLLGGPAAAAGQVAGKQAGQGIASGVGASSAGIGATLKKNALVPLLGIGVAAFASAKSVESAYNTIRSGTGKTGAALSGLEGSFRNVAKQTPADLGLVATAIADVNKRLGLTGAPLEDVSLRLVRLSRLTGTDLKANVAAMTRVFGDWSIPTEKQAVALDKIYRASQQTGIGVDALAQNVVQFGSPLRQLGFGFEESLALFGRFEKEGVNTGTVLSGLRFGLKTFAKAGKDPKTALAEIITQIKGAGSAADANALAFKTFGTRAGPDMAAAIREGRFDLDQLTKSITNGKDSIANAAKDTSTLSGKFGVLKNQATLGLAALGTPVLGAFTDLLGKAMPVISGIGEAFGALPGPVKQAAAGIIAFAVLRGPLLKVGGALKGVGSSALAGLKALKAGGSAVLSFGKAALSTAVSIGKQTAAFVAQKGAQLAAAAASKVMAAAQWLLNAALAANPIVLIVAGIAALVAGVILAYKNFKPFRDIVDAVARVLGTVLVGAFNLVKDAVTAVVGWIIDNWPLALAALTGGMSLVVGFIIDNWDTIKNVVSTAINFVWNVIQTVVGFIVGLWQTEWNIIVSVVQFVWGLITGAVQGGLDLVRGIFDGFVGAFSAAWNSFWNGLKTVVDTIAGPIAAAFDAVIGGIRTVWNTFRSGWNSIELEIPEFDTHIPGIGKIGGGTFGLPDLPKLFRGGIVPGSPSGTPIIAGDRGRAEAIVPLPAAFDLTSGGGRPIEIHNHFGEKITERDLRAAEAATRRGVLAGMRAL